MSYLYDNLPRRQIKIKGQGWFLAKPNIKQSFFERLKDAFLVLKKKAIAVHFKEDEAYL